jgi:hypothetical protein
MWTYFGICLLAALGLATRPGTTYTHNLDKLTSKNRRMGTCPGKATNGRGWHQLRLQSRLDRKSMRTLVWIDGCDICIAVMIIVSSFARYIAKEGDDNKYHTRCNHLRVSILLRFHKNVRDIF